MKKHHSDKNIFQLIFLERSSGFSLAEVMVGAGILGALSLVVMNLTQNINRGQRNMENKFQVNQIHQQITSALRDRQGCTRTVAGIARTTAGAIVPEIYSGTAINLLDWRPILTRGAILGQEAAGSPIITVTDIQLISYVAGDGTATNTPEGQVTTTDGGGVATTRDYGNAIVRVTLDRGNTADVENDAMQAQLTTGRTRFERDFRIKVLADAGAVVECYAVEESVVEAACEALDGVFSQVDGLCREIKIQEDPADANSNYAITARGGVLVQEGGLRVGDFALNSAQPGTGNFVLERDAVIGGNATVNGNLLVLGTGQVNANVGIGVAPAVGAAAPRLLVDGNGFNVVNGGNNITMLNSAAGHIHLSKTTNSHSIRVDSANTANNLISASAGGQVRFTVTHEGRVSIPVPAAASSDTNPVSAIEIGVPGGPYFAAFIRNQPANPTVASNFTITGARGDEVATKRWAASVIYANLTTDTVNQIANNITTYAANNQLNAIKRMICESSRVRLTLGTGAESIGQYVTGSYAGSTCSFSPALCHGAAAGQRCGVLHVTGINSTGQILATGPAASVLVQNGASSVALNNTGTIVATAQISSNTLVTAPIVRGTGTGVNQGVCSANGCATRFGRQLCPGGTIMIGIARGQVVCAGALAPYSP